MDIALAYLAGFFISALALALIAYRRLPKADAEAAMPIVIFAAIIWPVSIPVLILLRILDHAAVIILDLASRISDTYDRLAHKSRKEDL